MLVTCMGRVSCYTCCGQSITVQVRFNWPSVRFLHILLDLLHLIFHFLSFFIVFLYSLPHIELAFCCFNLNYFLILSSVSFLTTSILFGSLLAFCASSPLTGTKVRETKMEQGKRNNEKRKEKNSLANYLFMTPHSREKLLHSLPGYLHLC